MPKHPKKAPGLFKRLAGLYERMDQAYAATAKPLGFTCADCPQNCCVSYFQHHTHVEWSYLWKGMLSLDKERREPFLARAQDYVEQSRRFLARNQRPQIMCPLNEDGRCQLYDHRLMICRLHGVAHTAPLANGGEARYPGCFRFERAAASLELPEGVEPYMDRTPLYRELAVLETEYMRTRLGRAPKVDLTLAEMLVQGPPRP